jgi:hypothetical protein
MTIKLTTGSMASGMSLSHFCNDPSCSLPHCTPPVENSNSEGGPKGADGQGVCSRPLNVLSAGEFDESEGFHLAWLARCAEVLGTPPAENSNPEGGPKGADGQGACTLSETDIALLRTYNERVDALHILSTESLSLPPGAFASAVFTARCALTSLIDRDVSDFRRWGMLLHVGCVV